MVDDVKGDILSGLFQWQETLEHDMDHICDGCNPLTDREPLEHFGTPCFREVKICEPGESYCKKTEEYDEISRLLDEVAAAQEKIENKVNKKTKGAA